MINIPTNLENENVLLQALKPSDFEILYAIASDPKIWEQHPNKTRYQREVFQKFFQGALESGGAYLIYDKKSGIIAGSTRFYSYDEHDSSIFIGYTFYATKFWGTGLNKQVKSLMLDYIIQYVDVVKFHVGKDNLRSRKAMEKLGAHYMRTIVIAYYGEPDRENVEYHIGKKDWLLAKQNDLK